MLISIVIINYKTPQLTLRCVESIFNNEQTLNYEVIVVDNASNDESESIIKDKFPSVVWIQNSYNAGFGRANNLGVSKAKGEYVLLLNSDMLLLPNNQLIDCIEVFNREPNVGVLGCKLINEDGSFQKSTYFDVGTIRYLLSSNVLWYKLFKPKPKSFDAIMGSFMLFKKKDFIALKGFDPDFFMYAEELELCYRLKKSNKSIYYFDDYTAEHKHGGSSEHSNWSLRQNVLSTALLYYKVGGILNYIGYHIIFIVNILTNFLFWYTLEEENKNSYKRLYYSYLSSFFTYFWIPIYYQFFNKRNFLKAKF